MRPSHDERNWARDERRKSAGEFLNEKEAYNYRGSHSHDWKEHDNGDAFCPICGGWRSVVGK